MLLTPLLSVSSLAVPTVVQIGTTTIFSTSNATGIGTITPNYLLLNELKTVRTAKDHPNHRPFARIIGTNRHLRVSSIVSRHITEAKEWQKHQMGEEKRNDVLKSNIEFQSLEWNLKVENSVLKDDESITNRIGNVEETSKLSATTDTVDSHHRFKTLIYESTNEGSSTASTHLSTSDEENSSMNLVRKLLSDDHQSHPINDLIRVINDNSKMHVNFENSFNQIEDSESNSNQNQKMVNSFSSKFLRRAIESQRKAPAGIATIVQNSRPNKECANSENNRKIYNRFALPKSSLSSNSINNNNNNNHGSNSLLSIRSVKNPNPKRSVNIDRFHYKNGLFIVHDDDYNNQTSDQDHFPSNNRFNSRILRSNRLSNSKISSLSVEKKDTSNTINNRTLSSEHSGVQNVQNYNYNNSVTNNDTNISTLINSTTVIKATTTKGNFNLVKSKTSNQNNKTEHDDGSGKNNDYIKAIIALTVIGSITIGLFGFLRCIKATRRASRALALPIPLLPEDRTPLNAEPENSVPMLSVQSPGYAGMERLGVPARSTISSPPDERLNRRMRVDAIQARDILVRDTTAALSDRHSHHHHSHHHYSGNSNNSNNSSRYHQIHHSSVTGGCPTHIPLPDGEYGQDRHLQIRNSCQQTEITRSYISAPPNKTVLDVPDIFSSSFSSSSSAAASHLHSQHNNQALSLTSSITNMCNLGSNNQNNSRNFQSSNQRLQQQQQQQQQQQKSKSNALKKFFCRQISPKLPSTSASVTSLSSSASNNIPTNNYQISLSHQQQHQLPPSTAANLMSNAAASSAALTSSLALPTAAAAALTATNCNLGQLNGNNTKQQKLKAKLTTANQQQRQPQQFQSTKNQLDGCISATHSRSSDCLTTTGGCNISMVSLSSSSSSSSLASLPATIPSNVSPSTVSAHQHQQSYDCCYAQPKLTVILPPNVLAAASSHRSRSPFDQQQSQQPAANTDDASSLSDNTTMINTNNNNLNNNNQQRDNI